MADDAVELAKAYLKTSKEVKDRLEIQRAFTTLGRAYVSRSRSKSDRLKAEEAYERAFKAIDDIAKADLKPGEEANMKCICLFNRYHNRLEDEDVSMLRLLERIAVENDLDEWKCRVAKETAVNALKASKAEEALIIVDEALLFKDVSKDDVQDLRVLRAKSLVKLKRFREAKEELGRVGRRNGLEDVEELKKGLKKVVKKLDELSRPELLSGERQSKLHEKIADVWAKLDDDIGQEFALFHYKKALGLCAGNDRRKAALLFSLAETHYDLEDFEAALECFKKELVLAKSGVEHLQGRIATRLRILECKSALLKPVNDSRNEIETAVEDARKDASNSWAEIQVLEMAKKVFSEDVEEFEARIEEVIRSKGQPREPPAVIEEGDAQSESSDDDVDDEDVSEGVKRGKRTKYALKRNEKGETELHRLCQKEGNEDQIKAIIEQGHPVNEKDKFNFTPLHEASNHGFDSYVAILLEHGANPNARAGVDDNNRDNKLTPLMDACVNGYLDVVDVLLDHRGTKVHLQDVNGWSAFDHLKALYNKEEKNLTVEETNRVRATLKRMKETIRKVQESGQEVFFTKKKSLNEAVSCLVTTKDDESDNEDELARILRREEIESERSDELRRGRLAERNGPRSSSPVVGAARDYADAIGALKPVKKSTSLSHSKLSRSAKTTMTSEEYDELHGDGWLEDDMGRRGNVKRKRLPDVFEGNAIKNRKVISEEKENEDESPEIFPVEEEPMQEELQHVQPQPVIVQPPQPQVIQPQQASVFQPQIVQPQVVQVPPLAPVPTSVIKRIQVHDRWLVVPMSLTDNVKTIGDLSEDISRRYEEATGRKPVIRVLLEDGAELSERDILTSIVTVETKLQASVIGWEAVELDERYSAACAFYKTREFRNVKAALTAAMKAKESEGRLSLMCGLRLEQARPIFRALRANTTVQLSDICLTKNRLGDAGLSEFADVLEFLPDLKKLNFACNEITSAGIERLQSRLEEFKTPLIELNIGFNPLTDKAKCVVCRMLLNNTNLEVLRLNSCDFTNVFFASSDVIAAFKSASKLVTIEVKANSDCDRSTMANFADEIASDRIIVIERD